MGEARICCDRVGVNGRLVGTMQRSLLQWSTGCSARSSYGVRMSACRYVLRSLYPWRPSPRAGTGTVGGSSGGPPAPRGGSGPAARRRPPRCASCRTPCTARCRSCSPPGHCQGFQQTLQNWQREVLQNAVDAAREVVLCVLVDGADVIDALDLVEFALMYRVDADPARAVLRARLAADADRRWRGAHGVLGAAHPFVGPRAAQVVQVAVGDPRQALVARVPDDLEGPPQEGRGGRSGECAVQRVGLGQQQDVLARVPRAERLPLLRSGRRTKPASGRNARTPPCATERAPPPAASTLGTAAIARLSNKSEQGNWEA